MVCVGYVGFLMIFCIKKEGPRKKDFGRPTCRKRTKNPSTLHHHKGDHKKQPIKMICSCLWCV